MPGFRAKFEASLRSSEQGADTVIWLATRPLDAALENGAFYFDRSVAKKHLPLAGTQVRCGMNQCASMTELWRGVECGAGGCGCCGRHVQSREGSMRKRAG
jgi:hypothetical protein